MVFPNFFITFVRHSFHTSHPCTSPSRERRHRPAPHSPHGTRAASRATHTPRILVSHSTHALHTTTLAKGYATRAALSHSTHAPTLQPPQRAMPHALLSLTAHTPSTLPPQRAMPRTRPTRKNAATLSLVAPSFLRRKSEPPQPKYYILQYYM